jgi:hypothetical protein
VRRTYPSRKPAGPRKHCRRGHLLTGANVIIMATGSRLCRTCRNRYMRDYHRARAKRQP